MPPMKVVTPGTTRLKAAQGQAGSPDKGKHSKQRAAEYMRIQAQQQVSPYPVLHPNYILVAGTGWSIPGMLRSHPGRTWGTIWGTRQVPYLLYYLFSCLRGPVLGESWESPSLPAIL